MLVDFNASKIKNKTVAVACSGGSDSMALLHYFYQNKAKFQITLKAINVEHGIRGKESVNDSNFVKSYCDKLDIPLISYAVDSIKKCKTDKISIEQSARALRYACFFEALNDGQCDVILTAHHQKDNAESVLLSLFRGTGLKGLAGITDYADRIIRPLLYTPKADIYNYIKENQIPYVDDSTNFCEDYVRNRLRLKVLPEIESIFPEAINSISKLSKIAKQEDSYLDDLSQKALSITNQNGKNIAKIDLSFDQVLLNRAIILALKELGIKKDWEYSHVSAVLSLKDKPNGSKISLPKNLCAIKEYGEIVIFELGDDVQAFERPFEVKNFFYNGERYIIEKVERPKNLTDGLYLDLDKIPQNCVFRTKKEGDFFKKFNGGTKSLSDYFTDNKIPLRVRDSILLIANGSQILAIFSLAISNDVRVDKNSKNIIKIT